MNLGFGAVEKNPPVHKNMVQSCLTISRKSLFGARMRLVRLLARRINTIWDCRAESKALPLGMMTKKLALS